MEEEKQELEGAAGAARRRLEIGVGFWEQGFRLFPYLVVNFFLKDGMGVAASSLQIIQASANLPMGHGRQAAPWPPLGCRPHTSAIRRWRYAPSAIVFYYPVQSIQYFLTRCRSHICHHQFTSSLFSS
jgi:hypothetical protein